ncbi:MAG TPA: hypothetical protein VIO57_10250 [Chloroflexota bacterium]
MSNSRGRRSAIEAGLADVGLTVVAVAVVGLLYWLLSGSAHAQSNRPVAAFWSGGGDQPPFAGPIDAAGVTPTAAYCLRACSSAKAIALANVVNIRNGVSGSTFNVAALVTGALDTATLISTLGTDASGTGSISTTTLTFTGGHVGDEVTGAGVTAGTYIVSGASPTWTVNISQTVASTTLTLTPGAFLHTWYDQGPNGYNCVQATNGSQPQLILHNGSYVTFNGAAYCVSGAITSVNQPFVLDWVALSASATGVFISTNNGTTGVQDIFYQPGDELVSSAGSNLFFGGGTTGLWLAEQTLYNDTATVLYLNGSVVSPTGGTTPGTGALTTNGIAIGAAQNAASPLIGDGYEFMILPTLTTGQRKALCQNQTGSGNSGAALGTTCN